MWRTRRQPREWIGFSSVDGRSPWRGITASLRVSRSDRSPTVSAARPRRSRRTFTTDRREGAGGQGPLPGGVPRLRRLYATAQRERGRIAYACYQACHPGAIERRWTRERVLDAMRAWQARYGRWPSSYDWSGRARTRENVGERRPERLREGNWPSASVVTDVYSSWTAARAAVAEAVAEAGDGGRRSPRRRL